MSSIIDSKADVPTQPWLDSGFRLWQLSNAWQRHVAHLLKDLEITHVQYLLLSGVSYLNQQRVAVTQKGLAELVHSDIMMTSKVVRSLEKHGLLLRATLKSDTRARSLIITNKGKEVLAAATDRMHALQTAMHAVIGDQQQLDQLLERLIKSL